MKYVILFEDDTLVDPDIRRQHMAEHLCFLEENAAQIEAAGPLTGPDGENAGGIWVVEMPNDENIETLIKQDPFWPTGLRKSYRILAWTQVFANSQRITQPG